ncbi:hypothetical protein BDR22DRAFT_890168 [Usnea florida]
MLEKEFHEDMDEQDIEDEGASGSRGGPGPRDSWSLWRQEMDRQSSNKIAGEQIFPLQKTGKPAQRKKAAGFDCYVRVRCDLKRADEVHPHVCAVDTVPDDPARRLGIEVTSMDVRDGSEKSSWCFLGGEQNAKKLNSLVDFLKQKPDGSTVQ